MNFSLAPSDLHCSGDNPSSSAVAGADHRNGVPKFKSTPPPSLPISSPSFFSIPPGLSPAELLDSPVLLSSSSILPSPTTGALLGQSYNWRSNNIRSTANSLSDFTFQTQPSQLSSVHVQEEEQKPWDRKQAPPSASKSSDDGYNWRKYGQKQVKASENPRSYYKCTFPGCPTKKKVEKSVEGQITEIVYKGTHSHPKPLKPRRSSSAPMPLPDQPLKTDDNSFGSAQMDPSSVGTPENSSISIVDDEIGSQRSRSAADELDDGATDERDAKRWKGEGQNECMSTAAAATGNRTVREPRVVVQTKSDIDILDDGYRWRKYGQKVVKGNPNPRSYYKCTFQGCSVRKHVERAAHDLSSVITTYEGKHNHDIPAARGSSHLAARPPGPPPNPDNVASLAIRPSAVTYATNPSNALYSLPYNNNNNNNNNNNSNNNNNNSSSRAIGSSAEGQPAFLMEMIQNPAGGFDFSSIGSSMANHNYQQHQQPQQLQYNVGTKEEPRDEFFESLLY